MSRRGYEPYGPAHHWWAGDAIRYGGALHRVRRARGSAKDVKCRDCEAPGFRWVLVGPATHEEDGKPYSLDPEAYVALCARCHRIGNNA